MTNPQFNQVELAKLAKAGDEAAFTELFERFHERILNYTFRMLHDRQAAEDATQDAFIQAYNKLDQLGPPYDFKSWVYRIAGNMALYQLRRDKPQRRADLEEVDRSDPSDPPRPGRAPEAEVEGEELGDQVRASLNQIPDSYQQALVLRELEQLPYAEMAAVLERSYDSVRQLVHRARTRFMDVHVGRMLVVDGPAVCDELGALLSGYHDNELSDDERSLVDDHVKDCRACQGTQARLRQAGSLLLALPRLTALPSWKQATLERALAGKRAGSKPAKPAQSVGMWRGWIPIGGVAIIALASAAAGAAWLLSLALPGPADTGEPVRERSDLSLASPTAGQDRPRPPAAPSQQNQDDVALPPHVIVDDDARCRTGPGPNYATVGYLNAGERLAVLGGSGGNWWFVARTGGLQPCWVWGSSVVLDGNIEVVPVLTPPPTPTFTPGPSPTPSPTPTMSAPTAPSNLAISFRTCSPTQYQLTLGWQDNSANETGFRVYEDGELLTTLAADATSLKVFPTRGTGHYYDVEAFNGAGSSGAVQVSEKACN